MSFESLSKWIEECNRYDCRPIVTVICANKTDLENRKVGEQEAKKYAHSNGLLYFETSSKSGQNVEELFHTIFQKILHHLETIQLQE